MDYSKQDIKRGELTGFFGFALAILFALLVPWVGGCNQPNGGYLPGDPCSMEGVEECAPACDICRSYDESRERDRRLCLTCKAEVDCGADRYDEGFADGVASVVCESDGNMTDECDRDVPPGHLAKHCPQRGGR